MNLYRNMPAPVNVQAQKDVQLQQQAEAMDRLSAEKVFIALGFAFTNYYLP